MKKGGLKITVVCTAFSCCFWII